MSNVLVHIGLTVTDMERSRRFYEGAFGFAYDRDLQMAPDQLQPLMQLDPPSHIHAVYLMLGSFTLELMQWQPGARDGAGQRGFLETGLTHLSIAVDNISATIEKVLAFGGTALSSVGRAALVRDPDGQIIELVVMQFHQEIERERSAQAALAATELS